MQVTINIIDIIPDIINKVIRYYNLLNLIMSGKKLVCIINFCNSKCYFFV